MAFFDKFFNSSKESASKAIQWKQLESLQTLDDAIAMSYNQPVAIFKHSTRCSISSMAKDRLERSWDFSDDKAPMMYFLDLIAYRTISNQIADKLKVYHESPQLILIKNGEAVYDASHNDITIKELKEAIG